MGYMDFNKVRYFDVREINNVWRPLKAVGDQAINSDSTKRLDSVTLKTGNWEQAQIEKENIEV